MNALEWFHPGDAVAWAIGNIAVQIALVAVVAILFARLVRRCGAAAQHGVWLCALICVAMTPVLTLVGSHLDVPLWDIALPLSYFDDEQPRVASGDALLSAPEIKASPEVASADLETPGSKSGRPTPTVRDPDSLASGHINSPSGLGSPKVTVADDAPLTTHSAHPTSRHRIHRATFGGFIVVWSAGVALLFVRFVVGLCRLTLTLRTVEPLGDSGLASIVDRVRHRLGNQPIPRVATATGIDTPMVTGLLRPIILLPRDALGTLSDRQLEDILVHEAAHAVGGDLWIGWFQRFVAIAFWPHPAVHHINRQLSKTREEVCDNYVLQNGDRVGYAETLLAVATGMRGDAPFPASIGLISQESTLEQRIAGLLDPKRVVMRRTNRLAMFGLLVLLIAGALAVAAVKAAEPETDGAFEFRGSGRQNRPVPRKNLGSERHNPYESITLNENDTPGAPFSSGTIKSPPAELEVAAANTGSPKGGDSGKEELVVTEVKEMRLDVVDFTPEKTPAVEPEKPFHQWPALASMSVRPRPEDDPATGGTEAMLDLVGPQLYTWGDRWQPTRILRDGNQFVVMVDWWREMGRDGTSLTATRPRYTLSLGRLTGGEYEIRLRVNQLFWRSPRYYPAGFVQHSARFSVRNKSISMLAGVTPVDESGAEERIGDAPIERLFAKHDESRVRRQLPSGPRAGAQGFPLIHRLEVAGDFAAAATAGMRAGVRAGTCNLARIWKTPPRTLNDVPEPQPAKAGEPVYAVLLGPLMGSTESMVLREIEWVGRKAILRVDLWRHGGSRRKAALHIPLLVTPLHADGPGDCEIKVEWSLLYKPTAHDVLYTRYTPASVAVAPIDAAIKRSFVKHTENVEHAKVTIAKATR